MSDSHRSILRSTSIVGGASVANILPRSQTTEGYDVVARYADRELLQSGWLIGEENLARRAAVIAAWPWP